jgi:nucleoside-diphosphate-sugar epimerase
MAEADAMLGQTLNVAAAQEVPIEQLIRTIATVMGYDGPIERRPARAGDHRRHLADPTRARAVVAFDPLTRLEDGLAATVEWYMRRPSATLLSH